MRLSAFSVAAIAISALFVPAVSAAEGSDAHDAAAIFKLRCGACHGDPNVKGAPSRLGPDLIALNGRPAAAASFPRYSPGLKASKLVWDKKTLDAFLLNPRGTVRGTTMAFPGLKDAGERAAVVAYVLGAKK